MVVVAVVVEEEMVVVVAAVGVAAAAAVVVVVVAEGRRVFLRLMGGCRSPFPPPMLIGMSRFRLPVVVVANNAECDRCDDAPSLLLAVVLERWPPPPATAFPALAVMEAVADVAVVVVIVGSPTWTWAVTEDLFLSTSFRLLRRAAAWAAAWAAAAWAAAWAVGRAIASGSDF